MIDKFQSDGFAITRWRTRFFDRSTDKIQAQIERSNRKIGESLERFEDMVDRIPDMDEEKENNVDREAMEQQTQEIKDEAAESLLPGANKDVS